MAILPDNEYTEFENRSYVNPQVSLDEQTAFIDNLRSTQQANNQQIKTDTYNLGTAVPSNLGGLTGGEGYFTSRYQTPQTNSLANDLRSVAQASALNQILENEQAKWKNRYNKARNANAIRNATSKTSSTGSNAGGSNLGIDVNSGNSGKDGVNENTTTTGPGYINSVRGGLNIYTDQNGKRWTLRNPEEGDETLLGGLTNVGGNLLRTFPDGTPLTNGAVYDAGGGRVFMYIQNSQYPNGSFFRVGDSPTMSYR